MAYDESTSHRTRTPADRTETAGADRTAPIGIGDLVDSNGSETGRPPNVGLSEAPDDHGEPGRDRMVVHVLWEILLFFGVAALAILLHQANPNAVRGAALDAMLVVGTALGLLAVAAGLTLRAGAPNLALGPAALVAAQYFAEQGDRSLVAACGPAALAAVVVGLALALFVVGFHVPSWAASLALALAFVVVAQQRPDTLLPAAAGWDPTRYSVYLFNGFVAIAVLGGLFGTVKAIRGTLGRYRPVTDPARRRGVGAATVTAAALVVSMLLAALAGVLLAAQPATVQATAGIEWSGLALGAALLGGTSAFGRRGGVFGTVFAVVLLTLVPAYAGERGWEVTPGAVAGAAIAMGLVATRLVETFGRPRRPVEGDDSAQSESRSAASDWFGDRLADSWSGALPAQPTDRRVEPWHVDRRSGTEWSNDADRWGFNRH